MLKMSIPVIVESLKVSKEGSNVAGYVNFLLTGGSINCPVDADQLKQLQNHEGDNILCEFQMSPRGIVLFNRPSCVFEAKKLIRIVVGQGGK